MERSIYFKSILVFFVIFGQNNLIAQTYNHPTTGQQNTYIGDCPVNTCSGTYYDNGGAGGNYTANINNVYRTFHPSSPGMCVRATFTSFSMNDTYFLCFGPNSCCDYLRILNGPFTNSPALFNDCISSPGTVTSTTGPLTFQFITDGSVQLAGWAATLSCVPCAGGQPAVSNGDCINAVTLAGSTALNDASSGSGLVAEACAGCSLGENYSNWYKIQTSSAGIVSFTIDPNQNTDDFDVSVYGPGVSCASLGIPIRCTAAAAAGNGNTGLGNGAVDNSEDITGDQWVAPITAGAGEVYYIMINAYSPASGSNGFMFNYTGTAGLSCPVFTVAPPDVSIINSSCSGMCTLTSGMISAPGGTPCPPTSQLEYQVNGGPWSTTLPLYDQDGPPQTIKTRCSCIVNNSITSPESAGVTTVPGTCPLTSWYEDSDNDSYGNPAVSQLSCTQPTGYVANDQDCNDTEALLNINPMITNGSNCYLTMEAALTSVMSGNVIEINGIVSSSGINEIPVGVTVQVNNNAWWNNNMLLINNGTINLVGSGKFVNGVSGVYKGKGNIQGLMTNNGTASPGN